MNSQATDVAAETEETAKLRARLREFDETLHAIQAGTVDALMLDGKVCSLKETETRYRELIEEMNDGAATLAEDGSVLYCNRCFANMVGAPQEAVIGSPLSQFVAVPDRSILSKVLEQGRLGEIKTEIQLKRPEVHFVPVLLSVKPLELQNKKVLIVIATDLTEIKMGIKHTQYLASIPESSPTLILEFDFTDKLVYINPTAKEILKQFGLEDATVFLPPNRSEFKKLLRADPSNPVKSEVKIQDRQFDVVLCFVPEFETLRLFGQDMTERKRAEAEILQLYAEMEQRVIDRTVELTLTNQELESFSYSISHDLRAPLRSIDGFSRILLEDYADALDAIGRENLDRIRAASQRMGHLIDDLLQLSRYTRSPISRKPVDLSTLARSVAEGLQQAEPDRRVTMLIEPSLVAKGDPGLIQVVLENLLANAWKFTGKTNDAKIEFGRTPHAGEPAFFVRDNGAGFDMTYADKLFGTFQRLHSCGDFPGTGIGLATVQRVIHRHHGRVWAEGRVGQGATFYFTLPEKPFLNIPSQNSHEPTV